MTINGYRFIFDGVSSDSYGVILCNIGSINTDTNDEETNIITAKTAFKDTWDLLYIEDSAPLKFPITLCRTDGQFIDADFQRELKKWLCKKQRHPFCVDQDDLADIFYNVIISNPRPSNVARMTGGLDFDVQCDSNHAWSGLKEKEYSTENGTLTFNFYNDTDFEDYELYPTLIITSLSDGDISIKNNTTNQIVNINNCINGEVITLDNFNNIQESSVDRILVEDWNVEYFYLHNGLNNITLTGNFTMKMEYRLPIRVGG